MNPAPTAALAAVNLTNKSLLTGRYSAAAITHEVRARIGKWYAHHMGYEMNSGGWLINCRGVSICQGYERLYLRAKQNGPLEEALNDYRRQQETHAK